MTSAQRVFVWLRFTEECTYCGRLECEHRLPRANWELVRAFVRRCTNSMTNLILAGFVGGALAMFVHAQSSASERAKVDVLEVTGKMDHDEIQRLRSLVDEHSRDLAAMHGIGAAAGGILLALQLINAAVAKRKS